jgi:proline iminopeptidase
MAGSGGHRHHRDTSRQAEGRQERGSLAVDGAVLRYTCEGSGAATLVIGSSVYYPRTFSRRMREFLRLVCVDTRHFAAGPSRIDPDRISLQTYLDDIHRLQAHLGLGRVVLVGHSHHGNLAAEYARRYPECVSHLVLIGSPPADVNTTIQAARQYWEEHASPRRKAILDEQLEALQARSPESMTPEQAYVARYLAEGPRYWHDPTHDARDLWRDVPLNLECIKAFRQFFSGDYRLQHRLEAIDVPVLVIMGRHDYAVPVILWDEVRTDLKHLSLHVLEHSGHTPQLEQPETFDRILFNWLIQSGCSLDPAALAKSR